MSFENFNVIKNWTIVICAFGVVATAAVAHYRIAEVEKQQAKSEAKQEVDRAMIVDLKSDIRVIREILERLDTKPKP